MADAFRHSLFLCIMEAFCFNSLKLDYLQWSVNCRNVRPTTVVNNKMLPDCNNFYIFVILFVGIFTRSLYTHSVNRIVTGQLYRTGAMSNLWPKFFSQ